MKLRHSAKTDVGRSREVNQDQFGVGELLPDGSQLFVMCDGMGGHMAGEVASQTAVQTVLETFQTIPGPDRPAALTESLLTANKVVYERGRGNMGTTAVVLLLYKNIAFIANVGDSRAYLVRGGQLRQLTIDHSFVEEQVRAGILTREQANASKVKNIITRAVGHQRDVQVDVFREALQVGDVFLLCSDGLHGYVDEQSFTKILLDNPPEAATKKLIDIANAAGGLDNITAVVVTIEELDAGASDDPLLASLLAQTPRPTIMLPETADEAAATGPTGTAKMPVMRDDPLGPAATLAPVAVTAPLPAAAIADPQRAAPPPTETTADPPADPPSPARERGLTLWGALGSLLVLAMIAGGLYVFQIPPFDFNRAAAPVTASPAPSPTLIPTVTSVLSGTTTLPATPISGTETISATTPPATGTPAVTITP
ncbi:MAG TPA: Stp1/IreP family PP2C-type Ser/Thr phosphatase [Herpetosiphonaceae bacterium]